MQVIDAKTVEQHLSMAACIALMRDTLAAYARGECVQSLRGILPVGARKLLGVMPAALLGDGVCGAKLITVFPDNGAKNLPSHQGVIVLFETETGALLAVVDAESVTAVRTAAASAAATDALARADAHVLALFGTGLQARMHLRAMRLVRDIREVRVYSAHPGSVARFIAAAAEAGGPALVDCACDARRAAKGADIVCTVTASREPVLFGRDLSAGAHVNAVGACAPAARELDSDAVIRARFFGDSRQSVLGEAGDFLIPLKAGEISEDHFLGEIGAVIDGKLPGRLTDADVTVFESLGLAAEDIASASYVLKKLGA